MFYNQELKPMLIGVKEAAQVLGLAPVTLRSYIYRGLLEPVYVGTRCLIPYETVERIARNGLKVPKG